jgi:hypothetical protein
MTFDRVVLLDYALLPSGRTLQQIDPATTSMMSLTAFTGDPTAWQPVQSALSNSAAAFLVEEQQREMVVSLRTNFSQLPAGKMALLPLDTSGAAANFAALTGLNLKWHALSETQMVDAAYFTAGRFPLTFYLGSENYVKTVVTNGDAKAAVIRYLAGGGTLVLLATGPFPFYYGYGPNDQAGPSDPLLPPLGLPIYNAFEQAPPNLSVVVSTNQSVLHSVPSSFPFPPGDPRLRSVNRSQLSSAHRYIPWLTVTNGAGLGYGDAACFIEFGSGPAKGGKILYLWSTLLSSPQGQALMADALSWIINATFRPPPVQFNSITRPSASTFALGFDAAANLDYTLQSQSGLSPTTNAWSFFQEFGSSAVDRSLLVTSSIAPASTRFFRLWARP